MTGWRQAKCEQSAAIKESWRSLDTIITGMYMSDILHVISSGYKGVGIEIRMDTPRKNNMEDTKNAGGLDMSSLQVFRKSGNNTYISSLPHWI